MTYVNSAEGFVKRYPVIPEVPETRLHSLVQLLTPPRPVHGIVYVISGAICTWICCNVLGGRYSHLSVQIASSKSYMLNEYHLFLVLYGTMCIYVRAPQGTEPKIWAFDAEHERKRKLQMTKFFRKGLKKSVVSATSLDFQADHPQIEEEDLLIAELKKIELRKKEREKKTQDLQKLITAADSNIDSKKADKRQTKKKIHLQQKFKEVVNPDQSGIKFADFKASGVSLRSQRMKLPASIGQKKMKAIEQVLEELGIEFNPMPTEEVVSIFNELRQDIVLLYELKSALANCDYETETLRHRLETVAPGKSSTIEGLSSLSSLPETPVTPTETTPMLVTPNMTPESPNSQQKLAEAIDVIGSAPGTPNRKRKAALEQRDILKKITKKL
ncbi:DMAP1 [Mytilus edulis]|uniref:DMAP1 n=1 Tax=Mytilus edulis TaxID=6550 RepID=A0A8S3V6W7_MYTED|nr:DMAP1 [Mytilus edulis]